MTRRNARSFRTSLAAGLAMLVTWLPATSASADEALQGKVYHHQSGSGLKIYGTDEYCDYSEEPRAALRIHDLRPSSVVPSTLGEGALLLQTLDGHDTIFVRRFSMKGEDCAIGIRRIVFDDGTIWFLGRGRPLGNDIPLDAARIVEGTRDGDHLKGTSASEIFIGYAGDDLIEGLEGDDVVEGGPGNDEIYGDSGQDWLVGGFGDDDLVGGAGDDSYVFESGHGYDVIDDKSGAMVLIFDRLYENEISFAREGNDLFIKTRNPDDLIKIRGYYTNRAWLARIQFDGSFWNESDIRRLIPR